MIDNVYTVMAIDVREVTLFPQTTIEEILQNVSVLLTTVAGSVPLDRNLGLNDTFIDEPAQRAMMKLAIFALETVQDYEPRVAVMEVDFIPHFDGAMEGLFYPRMVVRILDEYIP